MKKYIVETYYTCTFKTVHSLNDLNDKELAEIDARTDGDVEVLVPSFFEAAETAGVDVWVWMSDTSQENYDYYLELVSMGADGIINGRPEAMEQVSLGKNQ